MPWSCPKCKRSFKHKNQAHSCVRLDAEEHFVGKDPLVKKTYDALLLGVKKFGPVDVSPVKIGIMLKGASTFIAVKPKRSWIDMEFILDEAIDEYPVYKAIRYTKGRVAHFVRLEHPRDVSRKLVRWLRRSYQLVNGAGQ